MNDKVEVSAHTRARRGFSGAPQQPSNTTPVITGRSLVRQPLTSVGGILSEASKVYRAARDGKMGHLEARSFVWMLAQMRVMAEAQARLNLIDVEAKPLQIEAAE